MLQQPRTTNMFQNTNISPHTLSPAFFLLAAHSPAPHRAVGCSELLLCLWGSCACPDTREHELSDLFSVQSWQSSHHTPPLNNTPQIKHKFVLRSNSNLFAVSWKIHRKPEHKKSFPGKSRAGAAVCGTGCDSALRAEKMLYIWSCVFHEPPNT